MNAVDLLVGSPDPYPSNTGKLANIFVFVIAQPCEFSHLGFVKY